MRQQRAMQNASTGAYFDRAVIGFLHT